MKRALFLSAWFVFLLFAEEQKRLRKPVDRKAWRLTNNAVIGTVSSVFLALAEMPVTRMVANFAEKRRIGLLPRVGLPKWMEAVVAFVVLDYSIYLWHVMLHRIPLLWRFHLAHHTDRDLDASTALRFHFGELFGSVFWRSATIALLGIRLKDLLRWETFLMGEIIFHHSNWRLPLQVERLLNRVVVTPRMHGIHHSIIESETNSNWSSGLTVWDYLHGTLKLNVHQESITIGVPGYRSSTDVDLANTLKLPFRKQRYAWAFANGNRPSRFLGNEVQQKLFYRAKNWML